jgi:hypothetical protein
MHKYLVLAGLSLAGALAGPALPAFAQSATYSGFVSATGVVSGAPGFTGALNGTGEYTITAPSSLFPTGFPVMTVTPFGINGAYTSGLVTSESCGNGTCTFTVDVLSLKKAKPYDNAWMFTIIQNNPAG